jgi:hypothetical protein
MHFLNPGFLWALLALAIPVLIHLFNFQRTERIVFANTKLLTEVVQQTNKARNLKNLLLLLIRLAGLAFLILAFAQPVKDNSAANQSGGLPKVCVYMDNSASMFLPDEGNRAFEKSVAFAKGIPSQFQKKGWFELISNDFLSRHTWTSSSGFSDQLTEINESNEPRSFATVINRASRQFDFQSAEGEKHLFILSDFQKSSFGNLSELPLDSSIRFHLVSMKHEKASNVWIDSVWLPKPLSSDIRQNEVKVKVSALGTGKEKSTRIQLFANGNLLSGKVITVVEGGSMICSLPFQIKPGVRLNCSVLLDDQDISFDNRFYFTLQAPKPTRIYLISGNSKSYIPKVYSNPDLFLFKRSDYSNPDYKALQNAGLVILEGPESPGAALEESVLKVLSEGGSVCAIPGNDRNWVTSFCKKTGLDAISVQDNSRPTDWKINLPDAGNTFFRDVFEEGGQNKIKPWAKLLLDVSNGTPILKYESGKAFLSLRKKEKGSLFIMGSSLDEKNSSLPSHPLMIPVFYRMAFSAGEQSNQTLYLSPGAKEISLPLDTMPIGSESAVELIQEGKTLLANVIRSEKSIKLALPETSLSAGFWEIRKDKKSLGFLAVNLAKGESVPSFHTEDELKEIFKDKPWVDVAGVNSNSSPEHLTGEKINEISFWKYCICLAILMFALEMLIIRFGKSGVIN